MFLSGAKPCWVSSSLLGCWKLYRWMPQTHCMSHCRFVAVCIFAAESGVQHRTCRRAGEHSLDRQEMLVLTDFLSKQVLGAWQCRFGSIVCEFNMFNSTPNIKKCRTVFLDHIGHLEGTCKEVFMNSEPTHCHPKSPENHAHLSRTTWRAPNINFGVRPL